jgi:hypothetical protein
MPFFFRDDAYKAHYYKRTQPDDIQITPHLIMVGKKVEENH